MASRLETLPNEILANILTCFSTASLLPLFTISQRFHTLILKVLHQRVLHTWPLPSHGLILEKYHPSEKWIEPCLQCRYLGTCGGLSPSIGYESSYTECTSGADRCAKLKSVYSRFRPIRRWDENARRRPLDGTLTPESTSDLIPGGPMEAISVDWLPTGQKVFHMVLLEGHELFTQICLTSSFVKLGPVPGVFPSVVKAAGGVIRVWRAWLSERVVSSPWDEDFEPDNGDPMSPEDDRDVLWADWKHNIGLRVRVREMEGFSSTSSRRLEDWRDPDERPMAYTIEILELVIRNSHLVLAVERLIEEQGATSGKAIIFGSLDPALNQGTVQT